MGIINAKETKWADLDSLAIRVLLKSFEILGGLRKLIERKDLTWLPFLILASYIIVMSKEMLKTEDEIAGLLGLTRQTVKNILRADEELVTKKLEGKLKVKNVRTQVAGGIAKLAYKEVKEGRDNINLILSMTLPVMEALDILWPQEVLIYARNVKFPSTKEELAEKLRGLRIDGTDISKLLALIKDYPIKNPIELIKKLREAIEEEINETKQLELGI